MPEGWNAGWQGNAQQIERRRKQIDEPDVGGDPSAADDPRAAQDQRHRERRLIHEKTVERLLMLPEPLAVIRRHGQQRL